jgi:hypothetical protein
MGDAWRNARRCGKSGKAWWRATTEVRSEEEEVRRKK